MATVSILPCEICVTTLVVGLILIDCLRLFVLFTQVQFHSMCSF